MIFATTTSKVAPALFGALLAAGAALADEPVRVSESGKLGGDLGGVRTALAERGLEIGLEYTGETMGVVSGGVKRGAVYEGIVVAQIDADLDKFVGWSGGTAHAEFLEAHGRFPSGDLLGGNLMDVSNIEAAKYVRLYTLWLEQSLLDDKLAIQVGQLAADSEFAASDTAGGLLNGTFGWPILNSANLTGGGPAYPLPQPGVRLRVGPLSDVTFMLAVFGGNPGGKGCTDDPQLCNRHGTEFSVGGGTFWIGEVQYAAELGAAKLPGAYKLGAWRETGAFADQFTGAPSHQGDYGIYAIADQMLWRRQGTEHQGLSVFLRVGVAPEDRNLIAWYADGGVGFTGPFPGRPDDVVTLGIAYGGISNDASDADRAAGPPTPVRNHEAVIELSYAAAVAPWWVVQPDVQYVIHPGGNVLDPDGVERVTNAWVLGLRTIITF